MPKLTKRESEIKNLMDLGMQVQVHHGRSDHEAAHSAEIKLKTEALLTIAKTKPPRDPKQLQDFIKHTRSLAKLGLATVNLMFPRRTA